MVYRCLAPGVVRMHDGGTGLWHRCVLTYGQYVGAATAATTNRNDDLPQNEEGLGFGRHLPLQLVLADDQHGFPLRVHVRAWEEWRSRGGWGGYSCHASP